MEEGVEGVAERDVRTASEARRWAAVINAENDLKINYMITVALLTEFIKKRREQGCQTPLRPVLGWVIDCVIDRYNRTKGFGDIVHISIKEVGKKREETSSNV